MCGLVKGALEASAVVVKVELDDKWCGNDSVKV